MLSADSSVNAKSSSHASLDSEDARNQNVVIARGLLCRISMPRYIGSLCFGADHPFVQVAVGIPGVALSVASFQDLMETLNNNDLG